MGRERAWSAAGASTGPATATSPTRTAELLGRGDLRIISCHLGGSSSLCAIRNGQSVATSMGMSPQSGLPQNNRVGDFDPFALPLIMRADRQVAGRGARRSWPPRAGCWASAASSGDFRDIDEAAAAGNARAKLALDVFAAACGTTWGRTWSSWAGPTRSSSPAASARTGPSFRAAVCRDLEELGIVLDPAANAAAKGEAPISAPHSRVQIWVDADQRGTGRRPAGRTTVVGGLTPC